jgi:hypothetical protein
MGKLSWLLKTGTTAKDTETTGYDLDGIYYGTEKTVSDAENVYEPYENDDTSDVGVSLSYEPIKEVAKAEPVLKKTFTPKDATDSQAVVDALKENRVIVLYMEELISSKETFRRFFDYVMGAVQALDAESVRADKDTVVLLPYSVAGDINEENVNEYIDSLEEVVAEEAEG